MWKTLRRKKRSWRIWPEPTASSGSLLVAARTRTSTGVSLLLPSRRTLRSSGTRSNFADFAEEERATLSEPEAADAAFGRAGEGAAFVAEDFAFHQGFGNRGAVDGDERTRGARRKFVNAAGDDFFAGAGFAGDENGCGTRRGHLDDAHDFLHRF